MTKQTDAEKVAELLRRVAEEYPKAEKGQWPNHELHEVIGAQLPGSLRNFVDNPRYSVRGYDGKGNWARIPWIGVHNIGFSTSGKHGINLAILVSAKGSSVYFSIQIGSDSLKPANLNDYVNRIRKEFSIPASNQMSLESKVARAKNYENADIFNFHVPVRNLSGPKVREALERVLPIFDKAVERFASLDKFTNWLNDGISMDVPVSSTSPRTTFSDYLRRDKYAFSPDVLNSFVASLATKPFVIFTGNSGTGKTKLAQLFAEWLESGENASEETLFTVDITPEVIQQKRLRFPAEKAAKLPPPNRRGNNPWANAVLPHSTTEWQFFFDKDFDDSITINAEYGHRKCGATFFKQLKKYVNKQMAVSIINKENNTAAWTFRFTPEGQAPEKPNRHALVPVGADWTDNRNVLGFVNHLKNDEDGKPTFQSTPVLDLVLRACADSAHPYFLILDEMNLSHVERYFSDFLSAMESRKAIPVHTEGCELRTSSGLRVPQAVAIPPNLFVVGTVNVDETTYMFSPKVLDRANVLEFRGRR